MRHLPPTYVVALLNHSGYKTCCDPHLGYFALRLVCLGECIDSDTVLPIYMLWFAPILRGRIDVTDVWMHAWVWNVYAGHAYVH